VLTTEWNEFRVLSPAQLADAMHGSNRRRSAQRLRARSPDPGRFPLRGRGSPRCPTNRIPRPGGLSNMLSRTLPYCIAVSILRAEAVAGAQVMTSPTFTPTSIAPAPTSLRPTMQATPNIQLNLIIFSARLGRLIDAARPSHCKWRDIRHPRGENQPGYLRRRRNRPWSDTQPTVPLGELPRARRHKHLSRWSTIVVVRYSLPDSNQVEKVIAQVRSVGGIFGRRPVLDRGRGS
jgi:hypothetical protein